MASAKTAAVETGTDSFDGVPADRAATPQQRRARFFHSGNAFNIKKPPVPKHQFLAERDRAFAPDTPTGLIDLDLSAAMGLDTPATTPLILTRYVRIRAGETLSTKLVASGELYYVCAGTGHTQNGGERIDWAEGDVFSLPGGHESVHASGDADSILWLITNEPELAFERFQPPKADEALVQAVHYPAAEIAQQFDRVYAELEHVVPRPGYALIFSSDKLADVRNITPTLTLAMNSLPPGEAQTPHRHNSVAVTLSVQGKGCYSVIDGQRIDWAENAVMVTPPAEMHSHHNDGSNRMLCLIVQDGGLYYHCHTMGFSFE